MKSNIIENRFLIECSCGCSDLLVFDVDLDGFNYIEAYFTNDYNQKLWWRIKAAVRLIFKPACEYRTGGAVVIDAKNIKDLEEAIQAIKKFNNSKSY